MQPLLVLASSPPQQKGNHRMLTPFVELQFRLSQPAGSGSISRTSCLTSSAEKRRESRTHLRTSSNIAGLLLFTAAVSTVPLTKPNVVFKAWGGWVKACPCHEKRVVIGPNNSFENDLQRGERDAVVDAPKNNYSISRAWMVKSLESRGCASKAYTIYFLSGSVKPNLPSYT